MPKYIVERNIPDLTAEQLSAAAAAAKDAAMRSTRGGTPIRYLRSTYVPGESKCYCLFEAPSVEDVREVNEAAALPISRIVEALHISAEEVA